MPSQAWLTWLDMWEASMGALSEVNVGASLPGQAAPPQH